MASLKKLLHVPAREKEEAKAKRLDGIKVAKEELVTVKAKVTAQVGIAYDLYRKLLTGDPEA